MIDWILKLLMPSIIALERSKTLSKTFSDTRQYTDDPKPLERL